MENEIRKNLSNFIINGDCHDYNGKLNNHGYGVFSIWGTRHLAHRASYEMHRGKIEKGRIVCHKCDNKKCINPKHLYLGSNILNSNDRLVEYNESDIVSMTFNISHRKRSMIKNYCLLKGCSVHQAFHEAIDAWLLSAVDNSAEADMEKTSNIQLIKEMKEDIVKDTDRMVSFLLDKEQYKRVKAACVENDVQFSTLIRDLLDGWLKMVEGGDCEKAK